VFDELLQELRKLEKGVEIRAKVSTNEDGYFDRLCSGNNCGTEFKVYLEDWKTKVPDDGAFCLTCGRKAAADEWNTDEQKRYVRDVAIVHLAKTINSALAIDVQRFNSSQKPGFIQLSLDVRSSAQPVILPIDAANAMRQKFTCEVCGCRYASIGAAFFCIACGHNSVLSTFDQTTAVVRQTIASLSNIRSMLIAAYDEDTAQNTSREMIENNLGRMAGVFEHFAKVLYERLPTAGKLPRPNVFQNVAEGSGLWRNATGKGYEDFLFPCRDERLQSAVSAASCPHTLPEHH
jgi:hypothetical protein